MKKIETKKPNPPNFLFSVIPRGQFDAVRCVRAPPSGVILLVLLELVYPGQPLVLPRTLCGCNPNPAGWAETLAGINNPGKVPAAAARAGLAVL